MPYLLAWTLLTSATLLSWWLDAGFDGRWVGAAVLMGIVSTVILMTYGILAKTNADLFWALFAFSAVIFLLPYIGLVLAFREMRRRDPDRPRPFRVPGGPLAANLLSVVCAVILTIAIFFFVYAPGDGIQWPVLVGAAAVLLLGEGVIRYAESQRRRAAAESSTAPR